MDRMKNIFNILKQVIKSVLLGSSDFFPSIRENLNDTNNGAGNFDYIRLATYIIQLALIIAFVSGKLSIDQLKDLLKAF